VSQVAAGRVSVIGSAAAGSPTHRVTRGFAGEDGTAVLDAWHDRHINRTVLVHSRCCKWSNEIESTLALLRPDTMT
jgi:hypothetical protein